MQSEAQMRSDLLYFINRSLKYKSHGSVDRPSLAVACGHAAQKKDTPHRRRRVPRAYPWLQHRFSTVKPPRPGPEARNNAAL